MKRQLLSNRTKNLFLLSAFLLAAFIPAPGKAYNILFYYLNDGGFGSDATKLATILTNAGNVVTSVGLTPANYDNPPGPNNFASWGSFDQVWDLRYVNANNAGCNTGLTTYADYFTPNWSSAATSYLNNCGKFFTFMENSAFDGRNNGLYTFLNSVGATSGFVCADSDASAGDNSTAVNGLPGAAQMFTEFAGGIPVAKLNGTAFVTMGTGWTNVQQNRALAAGWTGAQLNGLSASACNRGKLFFVADYSMWFFYPTANQGGFDDSTTTADFFSAAATWLGNTPCACSPTPTPGCGGSSSSPYLNLQVVCNQQGNQNQNFGVRIYNYSASPVTASSFKVVAWLYESGAENMDTFAANAGQTCNAGGSSCGNSGTGLVGQTTSKGAIASCTSIPGHFANQAVTFDLGAGSNFAIPPNGGYYQSQSDIFKFGRNNPNMDSGNWADDYSHIGTGVGACQDALYHDSPYYLLLYNGSVVQESLDTSGTVDPNTGQIPCVTLPGACTPTPTQTPTPSFTISKRVEAATAAPNSLILYSIDYSYINTAPTINDTVPPNTSFVTMGPGGTNIAGALAWTQPYSALNQTGTVWFLVRVDPGVVNGTPITNTASATNGVSVVNSNPVTTTSQTPNFTFNLSESASSVAGGNSVTYTLNWTADGSSLQSYDSYDNNPNGTTNSSIIGFDGTPYTKIGASGSFTVATDPQGNHYINALPVGSGSYPLLLRNGPTLDICQGEVVEGDMLIPSGAPAGADATMVLAYNVNAGVTQAYMVAMSLDNGPGNFFLQKNNGASVTYPDTVAMAMPVTGVWYTVKAMITQVGANLRIQARIWPRGTAEPGTWPIDYTDITPFPCGQTWQQGWQADGTADPTGDSFANLKVFGPGPIVNPSVGDSLPPGITYAGASLVPSVGAPNLSWSSPGTFINPQPQSVSWWGTVSCPGPTIVNQFTLTANSSTFNSNSVTLTVTGCSSPTPTPTNTPSPTPTNSPTLTPTNSPTLTPTPSITNTPANTYTPTISPTPTSTPPGLHVWPNPFDPKYAVGGVLKAYQCPTGSTMSFYTVSAELVRTAGETGGMIAWDGRNNNGAMVSTGTYYYVIQNKGSTLLTGKVLVLIDQ